MNSIAILEFESKVVGADVPPPKKALSVIVGVRGGLGPYPVPGPVLMRKPAFLSSGQAYLP